MRVYVKRASKEALARAIADEPPADYIYMYPPRQCYYPLAGPSHTDLIADSLIRDETVNLYFHFPFCRQICSFCNLFAIAMQSTDATDAYVDALALEVDHYSRYLVGKKVDTLYLGGGTPSLMSPSLFKRLFRHLHHRIGCDIHTIPEVALEVAPDTVEQCTFEDFRNIGVNRVNLGVQSMSSAELGGIGRRHGRERPIQAIETLKKIGFSNICVDLIYGLQGQTTEAWTSSVQTVAQFQPDTICCYPLTLRPKTGYAVRGYQNLSGPRQYEKYQVARDTLIARGYRAETHVRYVLNEHGGYRQKANHWSLQNLVGFGAGARSYLWHADHRNGYSAQHRRAVFKEYLANIAARGHGLIDGFVMDEDERRRKAVILGLISLDRRWFRGVFGKDACFFFPTEMQILVDLGLLQVTQESYALTETGLRYRDLVVQLFFSDRVRRRLSQFEYGSDAAWSSRSSKGRTATAILTPLSISATSR